MKNPEDICSLKDFTGTSFIGLESDSIPRFLNVLSKPSNLVSTVLSQSHNRRCKTLRTLVFVFVSDLGVQTGFLMNFQSNPGTPCLEITTRVLVYAIIGDPEAGTVVGQVELN